MAKTIQDIKLETADKPMGWYRALVDFLLVVWIVVGLIRNIYDIYVLAISFPGGIKALPTMPGYAVFLLVLLLTAIAFSWLLYLIRRELVNFSRKVVKYFVWYCSLFLAVSVGTMLLAGGDGSIIGESLANLIVQTLFISLNMIYFRKRWHMFEDPLQFSAEDAAEADHEITAPAASEENSGRPSKNNRLSPAKTKKPRYCKHCGNLVDLESGKCIGCGKRAKLGRPKRYITAVLSVFCVTLTIGLGIMVWLYVDAQQQIAEVTADYDKCYRANQKLLDDKVELRSELNEMKRECSYARVELGWYMRNAVFVTSTGNKYHTKDCPHISGKTYWLYNVENAEYQGYEPCLDCYANYLSNVERLREIAAGN